MIVGSVVRKNLRILRELGRGAMGSVYLAQNTELPDIRYAVKVVNPQFTRDPAFQERFHVEARNQSKLDHPNIVQVLDFFQEGGEYCLVLAYVEGKSLEDLLKEKGALPEKQALAIFSGILQGLDCAHRSGIIHRDIKPSNVMIDREGRARITDFGIAIRMGDARLTRHGRGVGTPLYMSPEQITSPQKVDQRSDVYSAGVVLFEMLTGKVPFEGQTEFAIEDQIVNAPRPSPRAFNRNIPERLSRIVLRALEKEQDRRFPGCGAFLRAIRDYRWPPQKKTLVAALALGAVVGAGGWVYKILNPEVVEKEVAKPEPVVEGATLTLGFICRDWVQIPIKSRGAESAEKVLGNSALAEKLRSQVQELRENVRDFTTQYANHLAQLDSMEATRVAEALKQPTDTVERQRQRQWLIEDFKRNGRQRAPSQEELVARCPPIPAQSVAGAAEPGQLPIPSDGGAK